MQDDTIAGATIAAAPRPPQPIDVELLVQWAVSRSGRLPWLRTGWRELSMDRGLTARPKRRPITNWTLAQATAGLTLNGRPMPALMVPGPDAQRVLAAIQALDPATAATVIACAREKIRPDWMEGVAPKRIETIRRHKKKHRSVILLRWEPCSPEDVLAVRAVYSRWHAALSGLSVRLNGDLAGWRITGFAAPSAPWKPADEKSC